jgi:hypothetical protein
MVVGQNIWLGVVSCRPKVIGFEHTLVIVACVSAILLKLNDKFIIMLHRRAPFIVRSIYIIIGFRVIKPDSLGIIVIH